MVALIYNDKTQWLEGGHWDVFHAECLQHRNHDIKSLHLTCVALNATNTRMG